MSTALQSGKIITFYSYKGGTGRTMMLANVAWILASNGKRVLAIDWDLEAPGLHRFFHPFLIDKELVSTKGLIDFIIEFAVESVTPVQEEQDRGNHEWYKTLARQILLYAVSLEWRFPGEGRLDFVPAGQQGKTYSMQVSSFD